MSWLAGSLLVLGFALAAGFGWYERTHPSARVLALIATLAALAALGRVAFAPLPNVKPTTDIVLIAGLVLGGAPGFVVGAVAALASNVFFGQGPWTPWQMVAWGLVGVAGAALARAIGARTLGRWPLALACGAAGLVYNAILDFHLWVNYGGSHSWAELRAILVAGLPFDLAHVAGNVAFCLAFGPALVAALSRFRARFEIDWREPAALPGVPVATAAVAAVLVAIALVGVPAPPDARAAVPRSTLAYLDGAQNADGGWGGAPGQSSAQLYTGWTLLGLAAAGVNPLDARSKGGITGLAFMRAKAAELTDLGELQRTVLVLAAAGRDPRDFAGRDLVAEILAKRRKDGSFAGRVNTTAFAVLALRAAGRPARDRVVRDAARWVASQANDDGGFNFDGKGGASGVDDTAAAIQGLVGGGRRATPTVRRATTFLAGRQNRDGGFPLSPGGASNAQSTAFAVQGLVAAGRAVERIDRGGRDPLEYLTSLIGPDGAVRYSRTSRQTPVWVTGQALLALARRPFPLARVPRAVKPRRARPKAEPARAQPTPARRAPSRAPTTRSRPRGAVTAKATPTVAGIPAGLPPSAAELAVDARAFGALAAVVVIAVL